MTVVAPLPYRQPSTISEGSAPSTPGPLSDGGEEDMREEASEAARRLLAISALDSMKSGSSYRSFDEPSTPSSTSASATATSSLVTSPATSLADLNFAYGLPGQPEIVDEHFLDRVSQMPLVSGALKGYERARNSNRMVKYGTDLVESGVNGVRKISTPVIGRVIGPEQLGQLDDFACRQLDRLGGGTGTPTSTSPAAPNAVASKPLSPADEAALAERVALLQPVPELDEEGLRRRKIKGKGPAEDKMETTTEVAATSNQLAPRSRWQSLIVEAGGLGAAVSEESMKSMQYCLEWLHYATAHLDHEILVLRDFIASLSPTAQSEGALVSASDAQQTLANIKRDVVETIRKVVEVVSKYAGAALPEHAKRFVRQSILSLPVKWTQSIQQRPATSQEAESSGTGLQAQTHEAAERVLSFAVESLDMLRGVTHIFGDSVERAEAWLERLRVVGVAQQQRRRLATDPAAPETDEDAKRARPRPRLEQEEAMQVEA